MKILQYGDGYPKMAVCDKCQSKLEYDPDDIEVSITDYNLNLGDEKIQRWRNVYITCPVCKHSIRLEAQVLYEYKNPAPRIVKQPETPTKKKRWWQK